MKLIDEKLVYELKYKHDFNGSLHDAFDDGVDFAEQQLKQKMVEFAEWCVENYSDIGNKEWTDRDYYIEEKTTEQLLKEFINQQK